MKGINAMKVQNTGVPFMVFERVMDKFEKSVNINRERWISVASIYFVKKLEIKTIKESVDLSMAWACEMEEVYRELLGKFLIKFVEDYDSSKSENCINTALRDIEGTMDLILLYCADFANFSPDSVREGLGHIELVKELNTVQPEKKRSVAFLEEHSCNKMVKDFFEKTLKHKKERWLIVASMHFSQRSEFIDMMKVIYMSREWVGKMEEAYIELFDELVKKLSENHFGPDPDIKQMMYDIEDTMELVALYCCDYSFNSASDNSFMPDSVKKGVEHVRAVKDLSASLKTHPYNENEFAGRHREWIKNGNHTYRSWVRKGYLEHHGAYRYPTIAFGLPWSWFIS
jgi:hypothetical protein